MTELKLDRLSHLGFNFCPQTVSRVILPLSTQHCIKFQTTPNPGRARSRHRSFERALLSFFLLLRSSSIGTFATYITLSVSPFSFHTSGLRRLNSPTCSALYKVSSYGYLMIQTTDPITFPKVFILIITLSCLKPSYTLYERIQSYFTNAFCLLYNKL